MDKLVERNSTVENTSAIKSVTKVNVNPVRKPLKKLNTVLATEEPSRSYSGKKEPLALIPSQFVIPPVRNSYLVANTNAQRNAITMTAKDAKS